MDKLGNFRPASVILIHGKKTAAVEFCSSYVQKYRPEMVNRERDWILLS